MTVISISGTPCTGKTEISKLLSKKLGYKLIQVNELAEKLKAFTGYDKKRECKILDMKKLKKEIKKIRGNVIIEGHTSHLFSVEIVIVLRCNPEILKKRLEERYPSNPSKVQENLEAEILGVITSEAVMNNKKVYEIDTSEKSVEENVNNILKILKGKTEKFRVGRTDWLEKYYEWINIKR
ncbi:MAG: adenylate kinase family protein [Candidatus Aenigmarchaeota archaeon]|nr:adenylate kinase family protein [Candidatus Aenigmarchaeota archaeon]